MNKENNIRQVDANNRWEKRKATSLISEVFPDVLEISFNLNLDYPNAFAIHQKHFSNVFSPIDKAYFEISCINKDCLFSDLSLKDEVYHAVGKKLLFLEGTKTCQGYNTFDCYEEKSSTCMTKLDFEINIKYKNAL
jgi:hypothetical protein